MLTLTLQRTYRKNYTRGVIEIPKLSKINTLELTYRNNERGISCVPEKKYILKTHFSLNFRECLKLYEPVSTDYWNGTDIDKAFMVNNQPRKLKEVEGREQILIHAGNAVNHFFYPLNSLGQLSSYKCNSKGCILVGLEFYRVNDINDEEQAYLLDSKKALKTLYSYIKDKGGFADFIITSNEGDDDNE